MKRLKNNKAANKIVIAPLSVPEEHVTGQQTAKRAAKILVDSGAGYLIPTTKQRRAIVVAFAATDRVVYGKAFDLVKLTEPVDLDNEDDVRRHVKKIVLYEVKSTSKKSVKPNFVGHFFSLSTAELLVAQALGKQFRFAFVNTLTGNHIELPLSEVFARARGIYPTWSIQF
jgi:hypothetical protein